MQRVHRSLPLLLAMLCAGCARTETFDIVVHNATPGPITLSLTKDGPPPEEIWTAPEVAVRNEPGERMHAGFAYVPPGRSADVSVKGTFDRGTRAILRVYRGDLSVERMTHIEPSSADRLDLPLRPGKNLFEIADVDGRLVHASGAISRPGEER